MIKGADLTIRVRTGAAATRLIMTDNVLLAATGTTAGWGEMYIDGVDQVFVPEAVRTLCSRLIAHNMTTAGLAEIKWVKNCVFPFRPLFAPANIGACSSNTPSIFSTRRIEMIRLCEQREVTTQLPRLLSELVKQVVAMSDPHTVALHQTTLKGRVMATAFMITVNPDLILQPTAGNNQDTGPLRLAATRFTAHMEECMTLFDAHVMVPKRTVAHLLPALLANWREFETLFDEWQRGDLIFNYRQYPVVLQELRAGYMQLPADDPAEMPLLHNIAQVLAMKASLEQAFPWLLNEDPNNLHAGMTILNVM